MHGRWRTVADTQTRKRYLHLTPLKYDKILLIVYFMCFLEDWHPGKLVQYLAPNGCLAYFRLERGLRGERERVVGFPSGLGASFRPVS
jgi:hypothetical protein